MKKFLLIASVAAIAVTAPAQAERGGRKGEQAQAQAEAQPSKSGGGQRAERAQQSQESRAERNSNRQQQASEGRANRQQASERRVSRQQDVSDRRASQQQAQSVRRSRTQQVQTERRASQQQAQSERRSRTQQVQTERRSRMEQAQPDRRAQHQQIQSDRRLRVEQAQSDRRAQHQQVQSDRRSRIQQAQTDRRSRFQQIESDRTSAVQQADSDRRSQFQRIEADRRAAFTGDDRQWRQQLWEQRAERDRSLAELRDRRFARWSGNNDDRRVRSDFFRVGEQVDRNWWYDDYVPLRYRSSFYDDDRYYYRYDGDYLYRLNRNDNVVMSLFPLLGGAYSVGQPLPFYNNSYYNVPVGYSSLYYDTPSNYYRYGDGGIYGVDPTTQLITGIVALLTGQNFGIGQQLPLGYDTYNVPYAYRSNYYDTPNMMYRYDDGYIYGVDPRSRLIETSYPVYGDYMVGSPWPSYAGYDYGVPNYYDDLYYSQPGYDYRFASGGIYQVDPTTQLVTALVALVTGQNFNVGQQLPLGYDAYNVPFAYRDDYYDTDRDWYRYADGRIYQVDPYSRQIRRVILV